MMFHVNENFVYNWSQCWSLRTSLRRDARPRAHPVSKVREYCRVKRSTHLKEKKEKSDLQQQIEEVDALLYGAGIDD
ncbi:hypothetical protein WN55_06468 [Dufourea novaeangliae]|uniref:Uncharacterized protein n=1 Tax=Dufourea novaeangliae TaxID=178035 RepID=A0A154PQ50_DUFNO|nr:hypothetical protein WN55_06468 [Dufourea novaeangliae]